MNEIGEYILNRIGIYFIYSSFVSGIALIIFYLIKFNPYLSSIFLTIGAIIAINLLSGWLGWWQNFGLYIGLLLISHFIIFLGTILNSFWNDVFPLIAIFLLGALFSWIYRKVVGLE